MPPVCARCSIGGSSVACRALLDAGNHLGDLPLRLAGLDLPGCPYVERLRHVLEPFALVVGLASALALLRFKVGVIPLVAAAAFAGLARHLLFA
jgi:hypothetical protein